MKSIGLKQSKYLKRRNALIFLLVASLAAVLLTPLSVVKQGISNNLPWIGVGILISESLFIIGLGMMALEAGHELGKNPFFWRKKLRHVVSRMVRTKLFWLGFWINAIGAVGTAVIVSIGIIKTLPPR